MRMGSKPIPVNIWSGVHRRRKKKRKSRRKNEENVGDKEELEEQQIEETAEGDRA